MSFCRLTYEVQWDDQSSQKVVIENDKPDSDIFDLEDMFRQLLAGAGFHPNSIAELFDEEEEG